MKSKKLRVAIPLIVLLIAAVAYVVRFDLGTLSSFGWSDISLLCPLGALSTLLASKTFVPHVVIALAIALVLMIVFGRAFCGWVCPVPVVSKLRELFGKRKDVAREGDGSEGAEGAEPNRGAIAAAENGSADVAAPLTASEKELLASGCTSCAKKRGSAIDSRHVVLGGTLLTAAIFGFPVFCLICPIGLTFATIFLVVNLFGAGDMTWTVIVVPALLLVEVVFFRKWCSTFCPLAAFMSIMGKVGRFFRPAINDAKCLEASAGKTCGVCSEVCPEKIDPRHPRLSYADATECTRCRVCVESCPAGAIRIAPWAGGSAASAKQPELIEK